MNDVEAPLPVPFRVKLRKCDPCPGGHVMEPGERHGDTCLQVPSERRSLQVFHHEVMSAVVFAFSHQPWGTAAIEGTKDSRFA